MRRRRSAPVPARLQTITPRFPGRYLSETRDWCGGEACPRRTPVNPVRIRHARPAPRYAPRFPGRCLSEFARGTGLGCSGYAPGPVWSAGQLDRFRYDSDQHRAAHGQRHPSGKTTSDKRQATTGKTTSDKTPSHEQQGHEQQGHERQDDERRATRRRATSDEHPGGPHRQPQRHREIAYTATNVARHIGNATRAVRPRATSTGALATTTAQPHEKSLTQRPT